MKKSVSQTPDGIPSYYIYRTASQLSKPLSILFNYSISTGQVPEIWKKALVTPIYKKGSKNDPKNYRPISLTSSVCRLLERIIHNLMLTHLQIHNIISPAQHGFLPRRSTQTQQIDFLNQLTSFHDQQIQAEVIYLDFSKAFDKVSHLNLLHVLNHINIHPKLINWIQNYLNGRTQVRIVEFSHSHSTSVTARVGTGTTSFHHIPPRPYYLHQHQLPKYNCLRLC